jgi:hypothetical protein
MAQHHDRPGDELPGPAEFLPVAAGDLPYGRDEAGVDCAGPGRGRELRSHLATARQQRDDLLVETLCPT